MHGCKAFWTKFNFSASAHLLTNTLEADTEPYERDAECFFPPRVSERATVQVPTGSHSQTVVTGWSNYWVVDTPAWRGFISSRKGDSQITVYPHPTPSSGLILQLQNGKATHRHSDTVQSHACAHTLILKKNPSTSPLCSVCVCVRALVCHHMPRPSPRFLSNTPTCTIKACWMTALCRCVWDGEQQRESERQMTPECCLIYIPPLNNNSTLGG